ncbi:hypothetical protein ACV33W_08650 [Pseudomonas aeruginosa]
MAFYSDKGNVKLSDSPARYQVDWKPGTKPDHPGLYRCQRCGFEDVFNRACETVPPCAECKTETTTWKLLVRAEDKVSA